MTEVLIMDEYIKREAALRAVQGQRSPCRSPAQNRMLDCLKADVIRISAADVAPVVHGRWIRPHWKNNNYCCDCSECGGEAMHRDYQWNKNGVYPICPNCGAKMDGGADHADD